MNIVITNEWPAAIPLPYIDYSGKENYASLLTDINPFVRSLRSRFDQSYPVLSLVWNINDTQRRLFALFFDNALSNGTSQFQLPLRFPKNTILENWAVRFVDAYKSAYIDIGRWQITADVELVQDLNTQTPLTTGFDSTVVTWDETTVTFDQE